MLRDFAYYSFVALSILAGNYLILTVADDAIGRQDKICQETC